MHTKNSEKVIIASNYLSSKEIASALNSVNIETEVISNQEEVRTDIEPIVMAAYSLLAVDRSINIVKTVIIPLIKSLRKTHTFTKPEGEIIVKFPHLEARFPFDLSEEDFEKQIEKIKALIGNPKIFITKKDEN